MKFTPDDIAALSPRHRAEVARQLASESEREAVAVARIEEASRSSATARTSPHGAGGAGAAKAGDAPGPITPSCGPSKPKERPTGQRKRAGVASKPTVHPLFRAMLADAGLPIPEPEYRFHAHRKWRLDYAWVKEKVAVEVDGGLWIEGGGRHNRPTSMIRDMEKRNTATSMGWRILNVTPQQHCATGTMDLIRETLDRERL